MREQGVPQGGFTLIETLLVMALVAVLLTLLLPSLANIRTDARDISNLARMRQHAAIFSQYTSDHGDSWPAFTDPRADYTALRADDITYRARYFDAVWAWPLALSRSVYNAAWHDPLFRDATEPQAFVPFWATGSLFAPPEFWNPESRTGPAQWGPTRAAMVQFPSKKALFVNLRTANPGKGRTESLRFAMCDGSAAAIGLHAWLPGYATGAGNYPGSSWLIWSPPGMCTIDGLRGRDLR